MSTKPNPTTTHCAPQKYDTGTAEDKTIAERAVAACTSSLKSREVKHLLLDYPHAGRVFSKYGIDFCCGGNDTLEKACTVKGLDIGTVIDELLHDEFANAGDGGKNAMTEKDDFRVLPFNEAASKIIDKHHTYLREEMPLLTALADKVARVHGGRHPELISLRDELHKFNDEVMEHLQEEEQKLFNDLIAGTVPTDDNSAVRKTILELTDDHMGHGASLAKMRELTNDYQPPSDGCNSYRSLFSRLKILEEDMHVHVSMENNFLFPRLLEHYKDE